MTEKNQHSFPNFLIVYDKYRGRCFDIVINALIIVE